MSAWLHDLFNLSFAWLIRHFALVALHGAWMPALQGSHASFHAFVLPVTSWILQGINNVRMTQRLTAMSAFKPFIALSLASALGDLAEIIYSFHISIRIGVILTVERECVAKVIVFLQVIDNVMPELEFLLADQAV